MFENRHRVQNYTKLSDIFEKYAIYNFDQQLINFLVNECAAFLSNRGIDDKTIRHFSVEFEVSVDQSYVGIRGGNLMASLWLVDVFPPTPQKYIVTNTCIFDKKKYIYDPRSKELTIKQHHGSKRKGDYQ